MVASSVYAERAFSCGGLTVSKRRHSLGDESVRSATVLASWARAGIDTLLPEAQLLDHIREKPKRPRNKGKGKAIEPEDGSGGTDNESSVVDNASESD